MALPDLAELGADRAPGGAGAGLGEADEGEREEADQHVRADPLVFSVEDGPQQERPLQVAEGALGLDELLVAERDVLGRQRRIAGGQQVLAVEPLLGGDLLPVEEEPAALRLTEVAGEGRVVAERALAAQVRLALGLASGALALLGQPRELALDPLDPRLAAGAVALGLGRVVANNVALRGVA